MPESSDMDRRKPVFSMLLLKLIEREEADPYCAYDQEPGFGVFAGIKRSSQALHT
ncbi:hypothetical protein [Candidatus Kuenenia stuttgartiensis]|uniref:hypothetical protein n=1 Tax=Kuenenia stuttgartiensis TaxID=174633 RepID=UPI00146A4F85|nr:hypothetical protein [Candidatus Kuenenia stuttgartiensis]